MKFINSRG